MKFFPLPALLFAGLSILLAGCGPNYLLQKEYSLPDGNWTYDNPLVFEVDIQDTAPLYDIYLDLTHSPEFSMQNLYVQIQTGFPDGKTTSELVSLELANKAGEWFGRCNSKACTLRIPLQQGAFFNATGKHRITIEQYTRKEQLPGVQTVALRIEQTDQTRSQ